MLAAALMLTGATGFIGRRLAADLGGSWRVVSAVRAPASERDAVQLDLTQRDSIARAFDAVCPAAVVHAGGLAAPDACEREPLLTQRVNVDAVEFLARLCAESGTRLVHFSTDLVFDGEKGCYREDDAVRPLSVYGRSKVDSELAALALCPSAAVVRVANCYGRPLGGRTSFVDELRANLAAGRETPGFIDQWRSPTAADQLPDVVTRVLADPSLRGVFHWAGADRASRYEAALTFCRVMGYDERLIRPASAAEHPFLAQRPRDTSLDSSRLAAALRLRPIGLEQGFKALKGPRG
jgi:dTDP-4-dehydrorhamnose reductase